jgi:hypothetical protein
LEWFDLSRGVTVNQATLPIDVGYALLGLVENAATQRIVVTAENRLYLASSSGLPQRLRPFQADGLAVLSVAPWPLDDKQVLVGGHVLSANGARRAVVTLLDVEAGRFLPEVFEIGDQSVTRIRTDAKGRLWALLPWSGQVVRLTPKKVP